MIALPTIPTPPTLSAATAKVFLYGPPGVGKSSLAADVGGRDTTLFIATEPGLGHLELFQQPCGSWEEFREIGQALMTGDHQFKTLVVDTVDVLADQCQDWVMGNMGIVHPSDAGYGKGWRAVQDEFKLRVAKMASLGLGVWFISHAQDKTLKTRVGEQTRTVPALGGKQFDFLDGFCDYVWLADYADGPDGEEQRVLYTRGTTDRIAKSRLVEGAPPIDEVLPLDAGRIAEQLQTQNAAARVKPEPQEPQDQEEEK